MAEEDKVVSMLPGGATFGSMTIDQIRGYAEDAKHMSAGTGDPLAGKIMSEAQFKQQASAVGTSARTSPRQLEIHTGSRVIHKKYPDEVAEVVASIGLNRYKLKYASGEIIKANADNLTVVS